MAHLVVAHYDLLLSWPPDYPSFTHAIVDEAHELAGVADEVYATEVRPEAILERLDDIVAGHVSPYDLADEVVEGLKQGARI